MFAVVSCYIVEIVFGYLEYHTGGAAHIEVASNGTMRCIKYAWTSSFVLLWMGVGIRYGQKLANTLKAGATDGPNPQLKRVQKYFFALVVASFLGAMYRLYTIPLFWGKSLFRNMPLCTLRRFYLGPTTVVYNMTLILQWVIVFAQQPG